VVVRRHLDRADDASGQSSHVEAAFGEQPAKQPVELEAEAAALADDDLLVEGREREDDTLAVALAERVAGDRQRLERDGRDVRALEAFERRQIGLGDGLRRHADAREVPFGVHHRGVGRRFVGRGG
jgi:hypothetical protein